MDLSLSISHISMSPPRLPNPARHKNFGNGLNMMLFLWFLPKTNLGLHSFPNNRAVAGIYPQITMNYYLKFSIYETSYTFLDLGAKQDHGFDLYITLQFWISMFQAKNQHFSLVKHQGSRVSIHHSTKLPFHQCTSQLLRVDNHHLETSEIRPRPLEQSVFEILPWNHRQMCTG